MFRDQIASKLCMSFYSANDSRASARESVERTEATIILEAPDAAINDGNCLIGCRLSDLSWVPVTEVLALTCLYLLMTNPFG